MLVLIHEHVQVVVLMVATIPWTVQMCKYVGHKYVHLTAFGIVPTGFVLLLANLFSIHATLVEVIFSFLGKNVNCLWLCSLLLYDLWWQ